MDSPAAPAAAAAEPPQVLVIDDSHTIRRSVEIFLRQGGYEVLLAEDGLDALALLDAHTPALIFCDLLMPRLDGWQTCALLRAHPRLSRVPVVLLSSSAGVFDRVRGRLAGARDHLCKPFTKDQLLQAAARHGAVPAAL